VFKERAKVVKGCWPKAAKAAGRKEEGRGLRLLRLLRFLRGLYAGASACASEEGEARASDRRAAGREKSSSWCKSERLKTREGARKERVAQAFKVKGERARKGDAQGRVKKGASGGRVRSRGSLRRIP
jgi:hypothetical protein